MFKLIAASGTLTAATLAILAPMTIAAEAGDGPMKLGALPLKSVTVPTGGVVVPQTSGPMSGAVIIRIGRATWYR
jgi:hypothetical protein